MFVHRRRKLWYILLSHRKAISGVITALFLESLIHLYRGRVPRPTTILDEPFATSCQMPAIHQPRQNATLLMLAKNSEKDGALASITSIEAQFNRFYHYPILFLNDQEWDPKFVKALTAISSGQATFATIQQTDWGYPSWIDPKKAKISAKQQSEVGILYGGQESYHHMCRYNTG